MAQWVTVTTFAEEKWHTQVHQGVQSATHFFNVARIILTSANFWEINKLMAWILETPRKRYVHQETLVLQVCVPENATFR